MLVILCKTKEDAEAVNEALEYGAYAIEYGQDVEEVVPTDADNVLVRPGYLYYGLGPVRKQHIDWFHKELRPKVGREVII